MCSASSCHDPPLPTVPDYQAPPPPAAPVGPADGSSSKQQRDAAQRQQQLAPAQAVAAEVRRLQQALPRTGDGFLSACPPCQAPVPITCLGGHTTRQLPCSSAAPFACEQPCGRPLACGNHTCAAPCGSHDPAAQPCQQCTLPCQVPRKCVHPCPLPCHPPTQPCPPCTEPTTRPCFCGKTTLEFACHEVTAAELPAARLCCGKVCHRALPGCPHTCLKTCGHAGACTSDGCEQEVTVRCGCKRRKEKRSCAEVQRLLQAATGSSAYDQGTSLRLLECDAACAKAAAAAPAKGSSDGLDAEGAAAAAAAPAGSTSAAARAAGAVEQEQQPRRKLSREEKARLAEEKARQKEAAARRRLVLQAALLGGLALLALLLVAAVRWLLAAADAKAQAMWGRQEL